jgi:2-iminobutanoate/2-iminopropanoate deaminase
VKWNYKKTKLADMKTIIATSNAPAPIGPYSQAVSAGGFLFASGQIAIDPSNGQLVTINILQETSQVMHNIGQVLTAAGMDYSHIIKTTIFLKDMEQFSAVNDVYGEYFKGDFPARETVQVSRLPKDVNVEISVIAFKG